MAEQRTQSAPTRRPEPQGSAAEEEIAAAIALILAGQAAQGIDPAIAIAAVLRLLPDLGELADDVSAPVSRLVVQAIPPQLDAPRRGEAERRASRSNLSYRAHYAIQAVKRIAQKVRSGEAVSAAFKAERTHFHAHLEASAARVTGARLNDAAAQRWGNVLGWHDTGRAHNHRPEHLRASGNNYDVLNPPTLTGGLLPGQALHCDCVPAPPRQGARTLR